MRGVIGILLLCVPLCAQQAIEQEETDFITSFVNNYGLSANARDTREYHLCILASTRNSLAQLEQHIKDTGLSIVGRMLIAGYQEDAIAPYYTFALNPIIDDEVSTKTNAGWDFAAGSVFGFLSGFTLKNVNDITRKKQQYDPVFQHIASEKIGLFDDRAYLFHRHAFGNAYNGVMLASKKCMRAVIDNDVRAVLECLRDFWKYLYAYHVTDGMRRIIATQDILFSIHYAQYLIDSAIPILHYFTGPDITYPIEVLRCQQQQATTAAQKFVEQFQQKLQPIDGKKTAYIFCSFVDGVGKSTLLGNIRNWQRFGNQFDQYERVDNSSSQRATLYELRDDVCIVDLPAQVSHFTFKPDGLVYIDVETVRACEDTLLKELRTHVRAHREELENKACSMQSAYAKQCALMGKESALWIPFEYSGEQYLFDKANIVRIKKLVLLEGAHSKGLKVTQPEHMFFTRGVSLPLPFPVFLDDLIQQMQDACVEQVVLVDFASMYPRTSRENIRVNFILQQLKLLFGDSFELNNSPYTYSVNPQDIYLLLKRKREAVVDALEKETYVRFALFDLVQQGMTNTVIDYDTTTNLIRERYHALKKTHSDRVHRIVEQKIDRELEEIERLCAFDKTFESVVLFDFEPLRLFSQKMHEIFTQHVDNNYLNMLWHGMKGDLASDNTKVLLEKIKIGVLGRDTDVEIIYTLNNECRDKVELTPFFRELRAMWYAALANLLRMDVGDNGQLYLKKKPVLVPPAVVTDDTYGNVCMVRRLLPEDRACDMQKIKLFLPGGIGRTRTSGMFADKAHCVDWSDIETISGVYAYAHKDCDHTKEAALIDSVIATQQKKLKRAGYDDGFVPTVYVYKELRNLGLLSMIGEQRIGRASVCSKQSAQLFVRAIATLEMILKDARSPIMVRQEYKKDFIAALMLLERVTLPVFFGITFDEPLFDDYQLVEPIIEWQWAQD